MNTKETTVSLLPNFDRIKSLSITVTVTGINEIYKTTVSLLPKCVINIGTDLLQVGLRTNPIILVLCIE